MNLKIVTWNCEGPKECGASYELERWEKGKLPYLKSNYPEKDIDIYAIQECSQKWADKFYNSECDTFYRDDINKGERGIALFSKNYVIKKLSDEEEPYRYVVPYIVEEKYSQKKFILIHVWTKDLDKDKNKFHGYVEQVKDAFTDDYYIQKIKETKLNNIICVGDFNFGWTYPRDIDKSKEFYQWIKNFSLKPINRLVENSATFAGKYFNDCCFVTGDWVIESKVKYGDYAESDHRPVLFDLKLKDN